MFHIYFIIERRFQSNSNSNSDIADIAEDKSMVVPPLIIELIESVEDDALVTVEIDDTERTLPVGSIIALVSTLESVEVVDRDIPGEEELESPKALTASKVKGQ